MDRPGNAHSQSVSRPLSGKSYAGVIELHILVLGAYGFIGQALVRRLKAAGHDVTGLGRSRARQRLLPDIAWRTADLDTLSVASDWDEHLRDVDAVVNAAGALQDGAKDDVWAVHDTAITALVEACVERHVARFVQISVPGAAAGSTSEFLRSKAPADACLKQSPLEWTILRPGVVIGRDAYGGTALLRMLAGFPLVQPLVFGNARLQTVGLHEVADMVLRAVAGNLPRHADFDLVEQQEHRLVDLVARFRRWLGFAPARAQIHVPEWLASGLAAVADVLGHLGWRPPLRSTALDIVTAGVLGDAKPLRKFLGRDLDGVDQTLSAMPATVQERWFARLYLAMPLMIATLSSFWVLTGAIALADIRGAGASLPAGLVATTAGHSLVAGGAIVDIALGLSVLYRPWAKRACGGMVIVTLVYLAAGTLLTPALWGDPLGPLLKAIPATVLAAITPIVLQER
jgi:uncharacterized protein YbjT (DUF2867 family)